MSASSESSALRRWRFLARAAALLLAGAVIGGLAAAWLVPLPSHLADGGSTVIEFRDGTAAFVFLSPDEKWRIPATLEEIDPAYLRALVALEDQRFLQHHGVDPSAIVRAAFQNLSAGRVVSGASTLSMQLARILEPHPRSLRYKVIEALRAMQLELRLSKRQILGAYLTFVPYGRNLEGIEAASLAYFGHRPTNLSPAEIATLLAVPQDPNDRFPTPGHLPRLRAARDQIARRLLDAEALPRGRSKLASPQQLFAEVTALPPPSEMQPFPRLAPHAAAWLRTQLKDRTRLRTTLDQGTQRIAERAMRSSRADAERRGAHNGALVVLDSATAEVRALVGNFDFFDPAHGGQIAGFAEARSPGSALKPFLYAMAIDRGLALPEFLVPDIPMRFGGYQPKNFDGTFSGLVRLEDALSQSLNLPFVELLSRFGSENFVGTLRSLGLTSLSSEPGHYGLSAIVGGIELTPLELSGLYAALARQGHYRPVRYLMDQLKQDESEIFSPGAAYLTVRALSRKDRPDFPARSRFTGAPSQVHWKTGTSFGHRDAWAAGSGAAHTAVVWLGNFDSKASPEITGSDAAGPILFDVLEALQEPNALPRPPSPTKDLKQIEVCAFSGHPATDACESKKWVLARASSVPTTPCPYHVRVDVDDQTGQALSVDCRAGRSHHSRSFVTLPADIGRWMKEQSRQASRPPTPMAGCAPAGSVPPRIASPPPGQTAVLLPGVPEKNQEIVLEAEAPSGARLSWFVDGEFLGIASADERLWWTPKLGRHEIVVVDEAGQSAKRTFRVTRRR